MENKLCKDNIVCCDDNCLRCANLIYAKYIEQKAELDKLKCDYGCYKVSSTDIVERQKAEIKMLWKLLKKWEKVFIPKDYDPNDDLMFLSVDVKDVNRLMKKMESDIQ